MGGRAVVKNSNGATWIGSTGPTSRIKTANGAVEVGRCLGDLTATSANGRLSVAHVGIGTVSLETALGPIHVGIPHGTTAYLNVRTAYGTVHNDLSDTNQPDGGDRVVNIDAKTSAGDIEIVRVTDDTSGGEST